MQQLIDLRNETPEAISLQAIGAFMEVGRPATGIGCSTSLRESRLVDTANQSHLFVFMDRRVRMPVGFVEREGWPAPQKHAWLVRLSEGCPSARKAVRSAEALA